VQIAPVQVHYDLCLQGQHAVDSAAEMQPDRMTASLALPSTRASTQFLGVSSVGALTVSAKKLSVILTAVTFGAIAATALPALDRSSYTVASLKKLFTLA